MIKRGPIIVIGIIVLGLLATPFVIGMMTVNSMNREVERIASSPGPFSTTVVSLERGWLDTTATIEIGLNADYLNAIQGGQPDPMVAMMLGGFTLPIIVEIGHGPVLRDGGFGLGMASVHAYVAPESQLATLAQQFLGMPYVLDVRGRSGFGSGFEYEADVPPIDFATPDMSVDSTGITMAGTFSPVLNRFEGEMANLSLQSPFASAMIESVTFNSDTSRTDPDTFPLGTGGASIGRIAVIDPLRGAAAAFSFEDFSASGTVAESDSDELVDFEAVYRIGHISVPGTFEVSDVALGLHFDHIDADALNEFYRNSSTFQNPDPEAVLAAVMPIAESILASDPVISIEPFAFAMPEGNFDGSVTVSFNSAALPTGRLTDLQNPAIAMSAVNANVALSASKPLAHRLAAMILAMQTAAAGPLPGPDGEPLSQAELTAMMEAQAPALFLGLTDQGVLADDGTDYTTAIRLENGALTANGQPLPFGF